MNSQQISTIATEPFIREFVYAIIQSIRAKNFVYEEKQVIHSDLVPKFSESVVQSSLGERKTVEIGDNQSLLNKRRIIPVPKVNRAPIPPPVIQPQIQTNPISRRPSITAPNPIVQQMPVGIPRPVVPSVPQMAPPMAPEGTQVGPAQHYNKINLLLNDPSVSMIECHGAGKPVMVIRGGQRQITRIILTKEDIKNILDRVSDLAHIPLLEGVFRAAVDNFAINATISDIIGSKFIIRKQPNYIAPQR